MNNVNRTEYILIVDDKKTNLTLLSGLLTKASYNVRCVISGEKALQIVQSEEKPNLILLDIMMEGIDGYQVCEILKANEKTKEIPIIFITALTEERDKVKGFEVGGADYITKPFQLREVLARVKHQLTILKLKQQTEEQNEILQKLNKNLEAKVKERTAKLQEQNDKLIKLEAELREALTKEKEINEFKSRIITTISHEYLTPLTIIYSSVEILQKFHKKLTEENMLKHFNKIELAAKRLTNLLKYAVKIEQLEGEGENKLIFKNLNLFELCAEIVEEAKLSIKQKQKINFITQGDCIQPQWDENALRIILSNLLGNAIKYSAENSVIDFAVICNEKETKFKIKDKGIGIPQEDKKKIFDTFYRGKNVDNITGTGLGLSLVKKSVELYSGKIEFTSKLGVGTAFIVTIPVIN